MRYKYSEASRKDCGKKRMDGGELIIKTCAWIGAIAVVAFWGYSVMGGGMTEKDIVCTKGGEAFGAVWQKLYRESQFDYVCKRDNHE